MPSIAPSGEGSLLLTGTFQTVFQATINKTYEGKIDLSAMQAGDTVEIQGHERIESGGAWIKYTKTITYNDAVDDPLVGFQPRGNPYGYRIQARQTAGTFRTIKYLFMEF